MNNADKSKILQIPWKEVNHVLSYQKRSQPSPKVIHLNERSILPDNLWTVPPKKLKLLSKLIQDTPQNPYSLN